MRRSIVAGNWKMHKTAAEAVELARAVGAALAGNETVETVLCPPFTALGAVAAALRGGAIRLGAQNVHWQSEGAFTGEISAGMLAEIGCRYVIIGHSERRRLFHETDVEVRRKTEAALSAGLRPIVCVGETLEQRESGGTEEVVGVQLDNGLRGIGAGLRQAVIAYEPVWAIGTGRTASAAQAQQVHAFVRGRIAELADGETAAGIPILYGGSVKPDNAAELFAQPDVDGGLIGGASLQADSFAGIVGAA